MYKFLPQLPPVLRDPEVIEKLKNVLLGNDLEWSQTGQPTILGLSDGETTVSVSWEDGIERFRNLVATHPNIEWVGHNIVGADLIVLEKIGIRIPLEQCQDTIIWHWLVNMHLAKSSGKQALEEDAGEKRGRGFYNLGTMLSLYTDLWHYKTCRGAHCSGPCPEHDKYAYNGLDCLGPMLALPKMQQTARLRQIDHLYPLHRELAYELATIQDMGVRVDVPYIYGRDKHRLGSTHGNSLDEKFRKAKDDIEKTLPFNPRSPKAVMEYFKSKGIDLEDSQEATINDLIDELDDAAPPELVSLLNFKSLGNGSDRWFLPVYRDDNGWLQGYLDENGYIHPRTAFFTSSGRLMQSSPNLQNISKRRKLPTGENVGKMVRRGIIAPDDHYIVRADLSNAEGRTMLYYADYRDVPNDVHTFMRDTIGLKDSEPFARALGSARDAAKSVVHASNYGEGIQLKEAQALRSPRIRAEISAGARIVFWDWTFKGKVVSFTGSNLARRAFGSATFENRAKALDVMTRYIDKAFPQVREFQKKVGANLERERAVRTPLGYVKLSYDPDPAEELKTALSIWGSQPTAHLNKLGVLEVQREWRRGRKMRVFQPMHDEILTYVHSSVIPKDAMGWIKEAMEPSDVKLPEMPGLKIPADPSYGPNWADQST